MWLALAIDYHTLLHHVPMMYVASVVALLGHCCGRGDESSAPGAGFRCRAGLPFAGIGIRQAGDNIVGSPLSDRFEDRTSWKSGKC